MRDKAKTRRAPTAVVLGIVAVILAVAVTVAWFMADQVIINRLFNISNFDATLNISFTGGGEVTKNTDGSIPVTFNSADPNYIGKLRVNVVYSGKGISLLRVHFFQEWKISNGKVVNVAAVLPFTFGGTAYNTATGGNQQAWFDNRVEDSFVYYATPTYDNDTTAPNNVALVTGFDFSSFDSSLVSDLTLGLSFEIQAVQVERYPQFWFGALDGSDPSSYTLPWPDASYKTSAQFI